MEVEVHEKDEVRGDKDKNVEVEVKVEEKEEVTFKGQYAGKYEGGD